MNCRERAPHDAEPIRARGSLTQVEGALEGAPFVRISSACLINMDHISQVRGNEVVLTTGETLFFSRPKKRAATERIVNYLAGDDS